MLDLEEVTTLLKYNGIHATSKKLNVKKSVIHQFLKSNGLAYKDGSVQPALDFPKNEPRIINIKNSINNNSSHSNFIKNTSIKSNSINTNSINNNSTKSNSINTNSINNNSAKSNSINNNSAKSNNTTNSNSTTINFVKNNSINNTLAKENSINNNLTKNNLINSNPAKNNSQIINKPKSLAKHRTSVIKSKPAQSFQSEQTQIKNNTSNKTLSQNKVKPKDKSSLSQRTYTLAEKDNSLKAKLDLLKNLDMEKLHLLLDNLDDILELIYTYKALKQDYQKETASTLNKDEK